MDLLSTMPARLHASFSAFATLIASHVFWVFAWFPGLLAITVYWFRVRRAWRSIVERVAAAQLAAARVHRDINEYLDAAIISQERLQQRRPRFSHIFLGAVLLTVILSLAAALSSPPVGIGVFPAIPAPTSLSDADAHAIASGVRGLVYAAYGAYVYVMLLLIGRINTSAVSEKFLVTSAVRCAIAMILGFMSGAVGIFEFAQAKPEAALFFLVGLFPLWALEALQRRARDLFQPAQPGCEVLPLCLVEGLDGIVVDRLGEIGVTDIEHLAYADPAELRLATLYSMKNILDWIDQAILITYVKLNITEYRRHSVRSSIDLAALYGDTHPETPLVSDEASESRGPRARVILGAIASATKVPVEVVDNIGRLLFDDPVVNRIWQLWEAAGESVAPTVEGEEPPDTSGAPPETGSAPETPPSPGPSAPPAQPAPTVW